MANIVPLHSLTFAPEAQGNAPMRMPAPAGAANKFEQLMFAPQTGAASAGMFSGVGGGLQSYMQQLSNRWDSGQSALKRLSDSGQYTSKDLVMTQMQMINCALDVEVSSKCASMFENGVQTLIQRGS